MALPCDDFFLSSWDQMELIERNNYTLARTAEISRPFLKSVMKEDEKHGYILLLAPPSPFLNLYLFAFHKYVRAALYLRIPNEGKRGCN